MLDRDEHRRNCEAIASKLLKEKSQDKNYAFLIKEEYSLKHSHVSSEIWFQIIDNEHEKRKADDKNKKKRAEKEKNREEEQA